MYLAAVTKSKAVRMPLSSQPLRYVPGTASTERLLLFNRIRRAERVSYYSWKNESRFGQRRKLPHGCHGLQ